MRRNPKIDERDLWYAATLMMWLVLSLIAITILAIWLS